MSFCRRSVTRKSFFTSTLPSTSARLFNQQNLFLNHANVLLAPRCPSMYPLWSSLKLSGILLESTIIGRQIFYHHHVPIFFWVHVDQWQENSKCSNNVYQLVIDVNCLFNLNSCHFHPLEAQITTINLILFHIFLCSDIWNHSCFSIFPF